MIRPYGFGQSSATAEIERCGQCDPVVELEPDVASGPSVNPVSASGADGSRVEGADVDQPEQARKIGQLAASTGLTVRTLHHYDHIGLVCPSGRSSGGHRLYGHDDVRRLYEVLALRQLGLPLNAIAGALGDTSSLGDLLAEHRTFVDAQLEAMQRLRDQLSRMISLTQKDVLNGDFLQLIQRVINVDDKIRKHFNDEQLAVLAERREEIGDEAIAEVETRWADLIPRVHEAATQGVDPAAPEAQDMAHEWMALIESFHGGDEGLRHALYEMQADNADEIQREYAGPAPEDIEFITRATADWS